MFTSFFNLLYHSYISLYGIVHCFHIFLVMNHIKANFRIIFSLFLFLSFFSSSFDVTPESRGNTHALVAKPVPEIDEADQMRVIH